jgi:uncharacterized protein (TIGR03663 family)
MRPSLAWGLLLGLAVAGALAFRLPKLDKRPMHTDEAVQAVKTGILLEQHVYHYNPDEFHGPTLHYMALPCLWLSGCRTFAEMDENHLRLVPVLLGVALIALTALLADGLGWPAVLCAATLAAVSPAFVFYNRYYIAETPLVFFTFVALAAGWRYFRAPKLGWALLCGAGLGLMYATKETSAFAFVAMVAALVLVRVWSRWGDPRPDGAGAASVSQDDAGQGLPPEAARAGIASVPSRKGHLIAAVALGALIAFLLFSAFFTNLSGPLDSFRSYFRWGQHAMGENPHVQPWYFHLKTLLYAKYENLPVWTEALIPALALVGLVSGFTRRGLGTAHAGLVRFLAFYTVVLTAIYAVIPYKTPWCLLGFLHGMTLLAGVGAVVLVRSVPWLPLKLLAGVLLLAGVGHLGWQACRANHRFASDSRNPYNYSQTAPDTVEMAKRIEELADLSPEGRAMLVQVVAPGSDYWPLPFYLRRLRNVGYWAELPGDLDAPVIVIAPSLDQEATRRLKSAYAPPQYKGLRPSVPLLLYVRQDLWDAYRARIGTRSPASSQQKAGPAAP